MRTQHLDWLLPSCLGVDIQPVFGRSVLLFILHHAVLNNWRQWTRDGFEPGHKKIGGVFSYRSLGQLKKYTPINTHRDLYPYNPLPCRIASAPVGFREQWRPYPVGYQCVGLTWMMLSSADEHKRST